MNLEPIIKAAQEELELDAYIGEEKRKVVSHDIAKDLITTTAQAVAEAVRKEERERMMRWSSENYSKSTQPLYAHVDLMALQHAIVAPTQEK